jgi:hypothetical protein
MIHEMKRIWRITGVAQLKDCRDWGKPWHAWVRIASVWALLTQDIPNASLVCYHFANPLGILLPVYFHGKVWFLLLKNHR